MISELWGAPVYAITEQIYGHFVLQKHNKKTYEWVKSEHFQLFFFLNTLIFCG